VGVWTTQGEQSEPYSFYYTICIPPVQVKTWKLSLLLIPSSTGQPRVVKCPQRAREGRQIIPDWETEPEKISHRKLCLNLVLKFGGSCHGPGVGRWGCGDGGKYVTFMSRYGGLLKSCKEEVTQDFNSSPTNWHLLQVNPSPQVVDCRAGFALTDTASNSHKGLTIYFLSEVNALEKCWWPH
jgi:hypothetical protein